MAVNSVTSILTVQLENLTEGALEAMKEGWTSLRDTVASTGDAVNASADSQKAAVSSLSESLDVSKGSAEQSSAAHKSLADAFRLAADNAEAYAATVRSTDSSEAEAESVTNSYAASLDKLAAAADRAGVGLDTEVGAADKASAALGRSAVAADESAAANDRAGKSSEETSGLLGKLGSMGALAAVAGLAFVGAESIKAAENMQSYQVAIQNSAGISNAAAGQITKAFEGTAGTTQVSAVEMANAYSKVAGELGETQGKALSAAQALQVMRSAADLSEASGTSLDNATKDLANTMKVFKINADQSSMASNGLYNASRLTGQSVDQISNTLNRLAPALKGAGVGFQQATGLMVEMSANFGNGRKAITMVQTAIQAMTAPSHSAQKALDDMNVSFTNSQGKFIGIGPALDALKSKLASLPATTQAMAASQQLAADKTTLAQLALEKSTPALKAQITSIKQNDLTLQQQASALSQSSVMQALFGKNAAAMTTIVEGGSTSLNKYTDQVNKNNNVTEAADAKLNTLQGSFAMIKSAVEDLMAAFGSSLIPIMNTFAKAIVDIVRPLAEFMVNNKGLVTTLIEVGGAVTAVIALWYAWGTANKLLAATMDFNPVLVAIMAIIAVAVLIITHWNTVKQWFSDFVGWMESAWDDVSSHLEAAWNTVADFFIGAWGAVEDFFKRIWNDMLSFVEQWWPLLIGIITGPIGVIVALFIKFHDQIFAEISKLWDDVSSATTSAWNTIVSFFETIWNDIESAFRTAANAVESALTTAWNDVESEVKSIWNAIYNFFTSWWGTLTSFFQNTLNNLYSFLHGIWNSMQNDARSVWNSVSSFFTGIWNTIDSTFNSVTNSIRNAVLNIWNAMKNDASSVWNAISGGVKSAWKDIANAFVSPVNFVINTVWDNGIARVWNDTAGAIGLPKLPTTAGISGFAEGGYISGAGGPTADMIPAMLSNGEFVMKAAAVSAYGADFMHALNQQAFADGGIVKLGGGGLPGPTSGLGGTGITPGQAQKVNQSQVSGTSSFNAGALAGAVGGALGSLTQFVNKITGGLLSSLTADALHGIIDPLINAIPGPSGVKNLLHTGADKILDAAIGKMVGAASSSLGNPYSGGGSVASWIAAAIQATGVPTSWAADLGQIIKAESGGNPNAVNNTDSNAAAGDPSRGLMQTIMSTFQAYHQAGTSNNIFDPVANIAAGINYIKARYGSINNVPGIVSLSKGGAYVGYDTGGLLSPGLTLANNTTGSMEGVLNPTGLAGVGGAAGLNALNSGVGGGGSQGGVTIIVQGNNIAGQQSMNWILQQIDQHFVQRILPASGVNIRQGHMG